MSIDKKNAQEITAKAKELLDKDLDQVQGGAGKSSSLKHNPAGDKFIGETEKN